jgi:hypothetical protein
MELMGFLLPPLIDLINKKVNDSDARFWVSVFVCMLVGAGLNYVDTGFVFDTVRAGFDSLSGSFLIVFGAAQLVYGGIYSGSSLEKTMKG